MTNIEFLKKLVAVGMRLYYGDKPEKEVKLRILWELKHIIDAEFVDYYVMAFWIFRHYALSSKITVWPRGAMSSSIVCYCLGLTEVDPLHYGLHSARFVNDKMPKFQFDIERSRFEEFMKGAEDLLKTNANSFNIDAIRKCLFQDLSPVDFLSKKKEEPLPEDIGDELVRYALRFPQTMDMYDYYVRRKADGLWTKGIPKLDEIIAPTCGLLVFQEQMFDILRQFFHVSGIEANHIRLSIQRGEVEQVKAYKKELFADLTGLSDKKAERVWQILTSNPKAFLKAHAVSQVLEYHKYDL